MSKKDYEVGDCKPPVHSQFKKGQSGNPKGRPKGTKNLKTDLAEELAERVSINENGKQRKLSKQRLMLKSLVTKAIKGDARAADLVVRTIAQTMGLDAEDQSVAPLAPDDAAIMEQFISDMTSPNQRESKEHDHENE
jgi:hypothetical protein